jgi:hypothetical protein
MRVLKRIVVGIVIIGVLMICGFVESHYTRTVIVQKVEGAEVVVEDCYGHQWVFEGEGFTEKQEIKVLMNSNDTDRNVLDDKIVRVID